MVVLGEQLNEDDEIAQAIAESLKYQVERSDEKIPNEDSSPEPLSDMKKK
jgi:hypothetical protein